MKQMVGLRRDLHRQPESSGREEQTSRRIRAELEPFGPDRLITGLGGHGLAAVFDSGHPGPRVLLRCELDALPIDETTRLAHRSQTEGIAHKCGHDGHMAILVGLAERLGRTRPEKGAAILIFQPSEETGEGAAAVLDDPKFSEVQPDYALALHNLPGFPRGSVIVRPGPFAAASTGIEINLTGASSHASEPQAGRSPAPAVAQLIQNLSALGQYHTALHESAQVTVIHARVGEIAFGTSPGEGVVMVTLRSHSPEVMERLRQQVLDHARATAAQFGLSMSSSEREPFPATHNDPEVADLVAAAAESLGGEVIRPDHPFPWSEDFGHFTARYPGALFGLGAGQDQPALHHPDYDFPDELIPIGIDILVEIVRRLGAKSDV